MKCDCGKIMCTFLPLAQDLLNSCWDIESQSCFKWNCK